MGIFLMWLPSSDTQVETTPYAANQSTSTLTVESESAERVGRNQGIQKYDLIFIPKPKKN